MSIVALKRRASLVNNKSGKDPNVRLVVRGPGQTTVITSGGGGFSLNGQYRNIGYVGMNSLLSQSGSNMKPGTTDWKGSGGCCGGYENNPSQINHCCLDGSNTVKPSTLNTKGMLAGKNRWTKRNIPASNFTNNGATEAPANNQIQEIYNNWVSTESGHYNTKKSSQQYTENLAATVNFKFQKKSDGGTKNCAVASDGSCAAGHHIGGKYKPVKPYAKFLNHTESSDRAISNAIAKRASLFPQGYDKPFPYQPQPNLCIPRATQADDPNVLRNYYADENNTTIFDCPDAE